MPEVYGESRAGGTRQLNRRDGDVDRPVPARTTFDVACVYGPMRTYASGRSALPFDLLERSSISHVDPERDLRLLTRAKWVGVVLPIGLIWAFELVRYFVIDPTVPADSAHLFAALVMSGGAVLFALGIFAVLDRTQRRLVDTNRDLAATHAVASGLQGDQELRAMLEAALDRVLEHTGALAGQICVSGPGDQPLKVRRPGDLGDSAGMQWAHTILD